MSKYVSGFCGTKHHHNCKHTLTYYDKTWTCECECHTSDSTSDKSAQPQKVSNEKLTETVLDKEPNSNKNKSSKDTSKGSDK